MNAPDTGQSALLGTCYLSHVLNGVSEASFVAETHLSIKYCRCLHNFGYSMYLHLNTAKQQLGFLKCFLCGRDVLLIAKNIFA